MLLFNRKRCSFDIFASLSSRFVRCCCKKTCFKHIDLIYTFCQRFTHFFFLGMKRLSIRRTMLDNVCAGRQACRNASYVLGNLSHTNGTIFCPKIYCRCIIGLNPWHFWIPQLLLSVIFKILGKKHVVYSKTVKDFSSRWYTCSQLPRDLLRWRGGAKWEESCVISKLASFSFFTRSY